MEKVAIIPHGSGGFGALELWGDHWHHWETLGVGAQSPGWKASLSPCSGLELSMTCMIS
jgi:hypothetical protein